MKENKRCIAKNTEFKSRVEKLEARLVIVK